MRGRSKKTSGCVATKGKLPAVVARNPGSCLRFKRETAVVDPPNVLRRFRSAFHSLRDDDSGNRTVLGTFQEMKCMERSIKKYKMLEYLNIYTHLHSFGSVFSLFHEQIFEFLFASNGESPVSRWCPVSETGVCLDGHFFSQQVKDHSKRVQTWSIQSFKDGRSDFEGILFSIVHTREGVGGSAALDMRLQHQYFVAVFRRDCATGQATHSRSNHNDVVFTGIARQSVSSSRIRRFVVLWFQRHVIRKRHDFVT